jgi:hypothetical protein
MTTYTSPFTGNTIQPTDVSYEAYLNQTAALTLFWPINGTTGNPAARIMDISFTTGNQVYMPDATQVSVGQDAMIRNLGSAAFTVYGYSGSAIVTVPAGSAEYIYLTNNSTQNGTWGVLAFGSGTYSGTASALAGYGLQAITTTLNQAYTVNSLTAGYTFLAGDQASMYVWSGGAGAATLPLSSSLGSKWFFLFKNNGTGTLTISTTSPDLIDGATSKTFQPGNSAFIVSTGTGYITVGYGVSSTYVYSVLTLTVTGGTYTLTASQASNTLQEYSGTLASNQTIIFPPVANLYVISNQTSGAFSFTASTGISGKATATIPSSGQATLFCDGQNFYNANTTQAGATALSLANGLASAPTLNFSSETSTGIYRPGTGRFGISVLTTEIFEVNTTGISVTGTGTFSNGVSGGTF